MRGREWTREEIEYLRKNYQSTSTKQIANVLGRTAHAVQFKANSIGVRKDGKRKSISNTLDDYVSKIDVVDYAKLQIAETLQMIGGR